MEENKEENKEKEGEEKEMEEEEEEEDEDEKKRKDFEDVFGNDDDDEDFLCRTPRSEHELESENQMDIDNNDDEDNVNRDYIPEKSANKYDDLYISLFQQRQQSYYEDILVSLIEMLQKDDVTSATFKDGHPLYETIQDCRSKHASKLQLHVTNKKATCPWFGLPWKKEYRQTKSKVNQRSKSSMISRYMLRVKTELKKVESRQCEGLLRQLNSKKKIFWTATSD